MVHDALFGLGALQRLLDDRGFSWGVDDPADIGVQPDERTPTGTGGVGADRREGVQQR
jgi:hypothetical protein